MNALITGAQGFIGKAFMNEMYLRDDSVNVTMVDDMPILWKRDSFLRFLEKAEPNVVFHIGACSDTQNYDLDFVCKRNIEATFIISDFCKTHNVPLIYSSSASCYGNNGIPETLYAWSKYVGEKYVTSNGGIALRYFNVYGYDESHKGKMASFIYQAFQKGGGTKIFPSDVKQPKRDFVYVKDVTSANFYAFENYEFLYGGVYDVGTGQAVSYEMILQKLNIPISYTSVEEIPQNYQYHTCANAINFMPGWRPNWPIDKGIEDYILKLKATRK
jgi:ADP-L-glycero-D-manno-heptose 6-epimerase